MEDEDEKIDLLEGERIEFQHNESLKRVWSKIQKLNEEITFLPHPPCLFYEVNVSLNLNHKIIKYVWFRFGYRVII